MVNMRLDAIRQVNGENAVVELIDPIKRPRAVDLVVRRIVTAAKDFGIEFIEPRRTKSVAGPGITFSRATATPIPLPAERENYTWREPKQVYRQSIPN
ncbi:MAG TPA: hypothetical protein VMH81_04895 [Bryobacteraceae bacterium]|nr:hypothetical protein [Bryobacteraceae bacterium]